MSDVRDLVGDLEPDELERLQRVHTLLEQAGPPPPLSPAVAEPRPPTARVIPFPRRYRYFAAALATAAALVLFGIGYLVGGRGPDPVRTLAMSGTGGARASLEIYAKDTAGNWPMQLAVEQVPQGKYVLWLTRDGRLAESCGSFAVAEGDTNVALNAPYRLKDFDGWVVVPAGGGKTVLTT
ncbi:hypothetical protein [Gaiella sp.]|jgi:hypothetical protein|uniref:hypothetical protein n=1 Tax=Gaiella sp. TaxID=2663207 RepID=UPI002E32B512|nr:hypothetical protein [Gaiella sp.]HEX5583120.1 hypothetical protein [Gaiella sp.]